MQTQTPPPATITKTVVECYKIRLQHNGFWANITIDANGNSGRMQVAFDQGSWQYYWPDCGIPFRQFLTGLDKDYLAKKFDQHRHFDHAKTLASYRATISSFAEQQLIKRETAKTLYAECDDMRQHLHLSDFTMAMYQQKGLMDLFDHTPEIYYCFTPAFNLFWERIWPPFVQHLQHEIYASTHPDDANALQLVTLFNKTIKA